MSPLRPPVRHVLLDADGVLQRVGGDWSAGSRPPQGAGTLAALRPLLGELAEPLLRAFVELERPALVGRGDVLESMSLALRRVGVAEQSASEVYALGWLRIEKVPGAIDLVRRFREAGYAVHLGTNQAPPRAEHMRTHLGYDALFDVSLYSCDVGVMKPDPSYFVRAIELIGSAPDRVLLVDDRIENVHAARSIGMRAVQWTHDDGLAAIQSRLARVGVMIGR